MTTKRTYSVYLDRHLVGRAKTTGLNLSFYFGYCLRNYLEGNNISEESTPEPFGEEHKRAASLPHPLAFNAAPPCSSEEEVTDEQV